MTTRFGPTMCGSIIRSVRSGLTIAESAERAGVAAQTVRHWLSRGRGEIGTEHAAFAAAVDDARAAASHAPMSDREFRGHLARAVRNGSVGAMRLWWRTRSEDELDDERELNPFAELDAPFTDSPAGRRSGVLDELDDPLTKGEQNAD